MVRPSFAPELIRAGESILSLLDQAGARPVAAFWLYTSESGEWRLVLADPQVASTGPRKAYERIQRILASPEFQSDALGLHDVKVIPSNAPIVGKLRDAIPAGSRVGGLRMTNNVVGGTAIEDAYIYHVD